jgi:hypothetical protein
VFWHTSPGPHGATMGPNGHRLHGCPMVAKFVHELPPELTLHHCVEGHRGTQPVVGETVGAKLGAGDAVGNAVGDAVGDGVVGDAVGNAVGDAVGDTDVRVLVGDTVEAVGEAVGAVEAVGVLVGGGVVGLVGGAVMHVPYPPKLLLG